MISKYDILEWLTKNEVNRSIDKHTFRLIMDMINELDDEKEEHKEEK